MSSLYTAKSVANRYTAYGLLLSSFLLLLCQSSHAQVKDSTVTAIYTDFKAYWTTSITTNSTILPDTSHNLLAFSFRGKTYSTGVNNAMLTAKIGSSAYIAQTFKAMPIRSIDGTVIAGNSTYIATAIKNDGDSTKTAYTSPYPNIRIADVLTDGKNGLDLGTGVTNLPKGARISFAIKSLSAKASTDSIPDLVFTQIADPSANLADTIFFYDINGNMVGNKKLVYWNAVSKLGTYKLDLYTLTSGVPCNTSTINGAYQGNGTRDIRMVAFLLTEFGITNADSAAKVKGIQIGPNGTSDQAFIAYNTNNIGIDVPTITVQPQTQTFCSASGTSSVTFFVKTTSTSGSMTYRWKKNGAIISGATDSVYTASGLTTADTANAYSVTVINNVGSITSDNAYVKYVITRQPADVYTPDGGSATFSVGATGATGYQWKYKNLQVMSNISGATSSSYTIPSVSSSTPINYLADVTYAGGTCTSDIGVLNIEALPAINTQPQTQVLCSSASTSATFSVSASGPSAISYQWYKNNTIISGATSGSYALSGLTLADTSGVYKVVVTSRSGSVTSSNVGIKYVILAQPAPASLNIATGSAASFTITTSSSVATGYQWQKGGSNISGATSTTLSKASVALTDAGIYTNIVSYSGGTCTSSNVVLMVENLPSFTTQPQSQVICNNASASVTYSVAATSTSAVIYQWYKNGIAISGATSGSYTVTGLIASDSANSYTAVAINAVGTSTSNVARVKFINYTQPASAYLATGNTATFAVTATGGTGFQWQKDGVAITGATSLSYKIDTVVTASAGNYTLKLSNAAGNCTTGAGVLTTSTVLYSKDTGDINLPATWGVNTNGSGSSPVDFTRSEHTFVIANRVISTQASNLTIAGTYDLGDTITTISPGTTLEAGRIIRTKTKGRIAGSATSNLIVHGKSDLYFDAASKMLKNLTVNTTDTVTLHTALNITGGKGRGIVRVMSGMFNTGDSLTLKTDSLGTASVGNSPGNIMGKVTIEQYIPAHRAWRLFTSPVSDSLAPTINAAWQEGAVSTTDNPHPGYGTHITYGAVSDGFDQNPQKTFSMKVRNASGQWIGVTPTNTTKVTDYPAYFFFIRGNRSYDIAHTDYNMTPKPTIIRTTGYLRQHTQPGVPVNDSGYTLVANPYASPVDFESMYSHSSLAHYLWMWNPNLAGNKGAGAYVLVYWNGSGYSTTPALSNANDMRFLQSYQGFLVKSNGSSSSANFVENDKDTSSLITVFGREVEVNTPKLEVNLNVYNEDSSTAVADGVTYLFSNSFNNNIDEDDITKLGNVNENFGIRSNGKLLALEQRAIPADKDSLQLSLVNAKSSSYLLDIVPDKMDNFSLYLYDRYLGTKTALNAADTNYVKIAIDQSSEASKAADRFVIVSKVVAPPVVMFAHISATLQEEAIRVDWNALNEASVVSYKVQRSSNGTSFTDIGSVPASGKQSYSFTDAKPLQGINYYRVLSINRTGSSSVSGVVSETLTRNVASYAAVYPNPLTSNHCVLELHNKPAGKYDLTLINSAGAVVYTTSVTITDAGNRQSLVLPASLAKGTYHLTIESSLGKETIKVVSVY